MGGEIMTTCPNCGHVEPRYIRDQYIFKLVELLEVDGNTPGGQSFIARLGAIPTNQIGHFNVLLAKRLGVELTYKKGVPNID